MKTDNVALITEAGNNLSLKFAKILKDKNFNVIIVAKGESYDRLNEIESEDIKLLNIDLTNLSEISQLYSYLKSEYGKLDLLINNAEVANGFGQKITDIDITEFKHLYDQNLFSVINIIKTLFPLLNKSKKASIVNITSALGSMDKMSDKDFCYRDYRMTAYSTAKSALDMLTSILSKELEPNNIKVKSFDPIRKANCTHNSVRLCKDVKEELLSLI
ncbi:SDR family NAD(P)-dependent oxidoreductase [Winogradskyella sp.]|uniref:SDR family NAD(P)-dependent oxidoreductase n=1 Tax=Winogradskyella sp. TaxID=1883156 RepID=UPI00262CE174|nr:SDR family NAD(P)-dependent oxidoreductase [Winogradskyella sp.]